MSKHIIATPKEYKRVSYVDAAGIGQKQKPCLKRNRVKQKSKKMIGKVIDRKNLRIAARNVKANKGSAGVDYQHAYAWSRTIMGGWAVSQCPILVMTITPDRLKMRGYAPMLDYYLKVAPQLNEPLYTRPVSARWRMV